MPTNPIPTVHLTENLASSKRSLATGRAYPLGELDRPTRSTGSPDELSSIVHYLNVEVSARYARTTETTFCNIYAGDYCYLAGVYLPHVWWTNKALADIAAGRAVAVKYAETVVEQDANDLYKWLRDFGPQFGWHPAASLDELQSAANSGQVCVISGLHKHPEKPGHISLVVPESIAPQVAEHVRTEIALPLQSQAGARNFCFSCAPGRWWEGAQFQAHSFWIHA